MCQPLSLAAVVIAGWSHKADDPLAAYTQEGPKALIPIAGKPMVAHVVDALAGSRYVHHVVVVGLDPAAEVDFSVPDFSGPDLSGPVEHVPGVGDTINNAYAGIRHALSRHPDLDAVIVSSCDVPTLTPAIVDDFIETCFRTDHDAYYSTIERSVMESRFPASRRSYVRLRDGDFAGGDLMLFRPSASFDQRRLWEEISAARKNILRQVWLLGLGTLFLFLTRRLTLAEVERRASSVLGMRGKAIVSPHAEVGMDVDKPYQLEIVRAELEARAAGEKRG